jgi:hypothetical protein
MLYPGFLKEYRQLHQCRKRASFSKTTAINSRLALYLICWGNCAQQGTTVGCVRGVTSKVWPSCSLQPVPVLTSVLSVSAAEDFMASVYENMQQAGVSNHGSCGPLKAEAKVRTAVLLQCRAGDMMCAVGLAETSWLGRTQISSGQGCETWPKKAGWA